MVAVQDHGVAFDFDHGESLRPAVFATAFQLAAHLHAWRKLALGNGLHQVLIAQAKGIGSRQRQRHLVAGLLAVQRLFNLGQRVAIAAVQVNHGLVAFFDHLAQAVGDFETQGDGGVFFDLHED